MIYTKHYDNKKGWYVMNGSRICNNCYFKLESDCDSYLQLLQDFYG